MHSKGHGKGTKSVKVPRRRKARRGKQQQHRSGSTKPVVLSRELSDTAFHRKFHRPLVHAFGRGNTRPLVDDEYMMTHNVLAAETNPDEVFPGAVRAATKRPSMSAALQASLAASGVVLESSAPPSPPSPAGAETNDTAEEYTPQEASTSGDDAGVGVDDVMLMEEEQAPQAQHTKSITPHAPMSMFEALSWGAGNDTPSNPKPVPPPAKMNSLRGVIGVAVPAGCRSLKSEAVANLLVWS
jgi:hypothetical protein